MAKARKAAANTPEGKKVDDANANTATEPPLAGLAGVSIKIGVDLTTAAKLVTGAWSGVDVEELGECSIRNFDVKCHGVDGARDFIRRVEQLAKLTNANYPSTYSLPSPAAQNDQFVSIWWGYFLPQDLFTIASDLEGTTLGTLSISSETWRVAEAYLSAFDTLVIRSFPSVRA